MTSITMDSRAASASDSEVIDIELDTSMYSVNPVFACENLPGVFPRGLARPIENRAAIDARGRHDRGAAETRAARSHDESSMFFGLDDDDDDDGYGQEARENTSNSLIDPTRIKRSGSASSFNEQKYKKARIQGGCPAVPKKVTADLDVEDQMIFEMKSAGIKDEIVSQRLIDEGGTNYDPKTIATRFSRIRKALYAAEQVRLEDAFSDYHEDEDEVLLNAHEESEMWFARELKAIQGQRWKMVADNVRNKLGKHKYSSRACRDRVEDLVEGTACVPQEKDSNPELRAAEAKADSEKRMEVTRLAKEKVRQEEEGKARARVAERAVKEEKRQERAVGRASRAAKKAEINRVKEEATRAIRDKKQAVRQGKRDAIEQVRRDKEQKEKRAADEKARIVWEIEQKKVNAQQQALDDRIAAIMANAAELQAKKESLGDTTHVSGIIRNRLRAAGLTLAAPMTSDSTPVAPAARKPSKVGSNNNLPHVLDDDDETTIQRSSSIPARPQLGNFRHASDDLNGSRASPSPYTLTSSPRAAISYGGLKTLLRTRNLVPTGTKNELVARLAADDAKKTVPELQIIMGERGLVKMGSKIELVRRLAEDDVSKASE